MEEKKEEKLRYWEKIISDCENSGLTRREYFRQNNLCPKTFYYWQRRLREEEEPSGKFAELSLETQKKAVPDAAEDTAAFITASGIRVEVLNTVSEDFLCKLMRTLKDA